MQIIHSMAQFPKAAGVFCSVALGNFDGVHLGHQTLIRFAVEKARSKKGISVVFAFTPHPLKVLKGQAPPLLTAQKTQMALMEGMGVDFFFAYPFDREVAEITPADFVKSFLIEGLGADHISAGFNYTFGYKAQGKSQNLREICAGFGCEVEIIPAVMSDFGPISSSLIREKLLKGEVAEAACLLGYCYALFGRVIEGRKIGRKLGFATANVCITSDTQRPGNGVYAALVGEPGGIHQAVVNVGWRPTVGRQLSPNIEAHLLDFAGDLYGKKIMLHFVAKLRNEEHFASFAELAEQIKTDCEKAKIVLTDKKFNLITDLTCQEWYNII